LNGEYCKASLNNETKLLVCYNQVLVKFESVITEFGYVKDEVFLPVAMRHSLKEKKPVIRANFSKHLGKDVAQVYLCFILKNQDNCVS